MKAERLLCAIGGISDRHIVEFAEVRPVMLLKAIWIKMVAAAACLCFAVIGAVVFVHNAPQGEQTGTDLPQGETIWRYRWSDFGDMEGKDDIGQSVKGSILLEDRLKAAMEKSDNAADVFAVQVTETSGAAEEDIYNAFVKPLGVDEEYMKWGLIFATAEQIRSLVCPPEFAIVLRLSVKPWEDVFIDEEYLKNAESGRIRVAIYLEDHSDEILAEYKEQLDALKANGDDDKAYRLRVSILTGTADQMIESFLSDYGISHYEGENNPHFIPRIIVELDTDLIARILEDERVVYIVDMTEEMMGFDF